MGQKIKLLQTSRQMYDPTIATPISETTKKHFSLVSHELTNITS